ncbi:AAA family ATPase, partial [Patescibacteria group bacterium]|nr:AAA family ATPase [Patescibacteria group bacterium]
MADDDRKAGLFFQNCDQCQGTGFVGSKGHLLTCPTCQEKAVIGFVGGDYIYWEKRVDNFSIFNNKLQKISKSIINAILIVFGIIGLLAGGLVITKFIQEYNINLANIQSQLLEATSALKFIFWLSLLTDLYAYFRMDQQSQVINKVPKPTKMLKEAVPPNVPFTEIARKYKLLEVSKYFTEAANSIVEETWQLAKKRRNQEAIALHLLPTLLADPKMLFVFARLGIAGENLISKVKTALASQEPIASSQTILSNDLQKLLLFAYSETFEAGNPKVDVPQLFLGIFHSPGVAREILLDLEVDYQKAKNVVEWINVQERLREQWKRWKSKAVFKPKNTMNRAMTARPTPGLDSIGSDLTLAARAGALYPLINRKSELNALLRVMQRGMGNVLLVGESGVGKKALVEGVAQLMASEEVPAVLQDKRLVEMSTAALVASASQSGQLEGRMFSVVDEIVTAGNVILYIDDVSNLVGSGGGGFEESVDVSDVLVSALSRGLVKVIGTVGRAEFSQYLQNNDVVMRNFTKIEVDEPDINTT